MNKNIAAIGGDPDNVMILVNQVEEQRLSCLYAMPEAAPYFNKASIESGPGVRMTTRDTAAEPQPNFKELNIQQKIGGNYLMYPPLIC